MESERFEALIDAILAIIITIIVITAAAINEINQYRYWH